MRNENDLENPTILTPQEARQGETSGHMRVVLAVSLALAIVVGVGFILYFG